MKITRWDPLREVSHFFDESYFSLPFPRLNLDLALDMFIEKEKLVVQMHIPGISSDNIHIQIEGDTIIISGKREEKKEIQEDRYYRKEIKAGSFSRTIHLPKKIDISKTEATYLDGVLSVYMPISVEQIEKTVDIKIKK